MRVVAGSSEPIVAAWVRTDVAEVAKRLRGNAAPEVRRIIAIDGRSGAGKSTLARRLSDALPDAQVLATDDVAWHHSMFEWADALTTGILEPFRRGAAVRYVPPGWRPHDRAGAVAVPTATRTLLIEGVGSSRAALQPYLDASVWVQSDAATAQRLAIERDVTESATGDREQALAFWDEWTAQEIPFLERDEPWRRADLILAGVPLIQKGWYHAEPQGQPS